MLEKISVKTTTVIFLLCALVLALCACVNPVDIDKFFENDKVKAAVEASHNTVKVINPTKDGLVGKKNRIEGLNPAKYYLVEKETDQDGIPVKDVYPQYVTEHKPLTPGQLYSDLGYITKISGGMIVDLKNYHTYTVRSAIQFPDDTTEFSYTDSGGGSGTVKVKNGTITIPSLSGAGKLSLDITSVLTDAIEYEIMAVAVSPPTTSTPEWDIFSEGKGDTSVKKLGSSWTALPLEGAGATVDYVIVNKTDSTDFKVFTVKTPTTINLDTITLTAPVYGETPATAITETAQYTGTVEWDHGNPETFDASTEYTATITLTAKDGFTLKGVSANFFKVTGATTATNSANSGVITAKFPATVSVVKINITFTINDKVVSPGNSAEIIINNFNGGSKPTAILTLTAIGDGALNSIKWYHNDTDLHISTPTLTLTNNIANKDEYLIVGTHTFTATAVIDGKPYSANFTLTVTE